MSQIISAGNGPRDRYWGLRDAWFSDLPDTEFFLPGLLPVGLTVLAAAPKIGKSYLAQQIADYMVGVAPLFGHARPRARTFALAVDLEGNERRTKQRLRQLLGATFDVGESIAKAAAEGEPFHDIWYEHSPTWGERPGVADKIAWLEDFLAKAEASGHRIGFVWIDTLRLFVGAKPRDMNAYDFDAVVFRKLDELAQRRGIAILAVHHTRKSSHDEPDKMERLSGSTGIAGSASCVWILERSRNSADGILTALPRDGEELEMPVRFSRGQWSFADDITTAQAKHTGNPRQLLDFLNDRGMATFTEIVDGTGIDSKTVGRIVRDLADAGEIECAARRWRIVPPQVPGFAGLRLVDSATEESPASSSSSDGQAPPVDGKSSGEDPDDWGRADALLDDDEDQADEPEANEPAGPTSRGNPAIPQLLDSIGQARAYAVPLIRADLRDQLPWSLAEDIWVGRHRWIAPDLERRSDAERYDVVILDRNAAYPSVMSSVPVASSTLTHTGDQPYDRTRAGLYLIRPPAADDYPPALGRYPEEDEALWVTTPHVDLLHKRGEVEILDSWTGKRTTALFTRFHDWARDRREQASPETAGDVKRHTNIAIRMLWPRGVNDDGERDNRGRIWRPDWWAAIVAEANVRHWVKAHNLAGLVALQNVDEVALAVPTDARLPLCVAPYEIGTGYGQVKVKARLPFAEWVANGHQATPRRKRG